jgi:TetR/AcrR family transcriptional regulator, regulator of cefoperazone and chloramphenicol sensitivity
MKKSSDKQPNPRVGRSSPVRKDALETRASLLSAAGELFASKGYDGVNVREVCALANANLGAIRYYFGGKRELYSEVVMIAHRELISAEPMPDLDAEGSPQEALRLWLQFFLRMALIRRPAHPYLARIMFNELRQPTEVLDKLVKTVFFPIRQKLQHIVAGIKGVSPDDPRAAEQANFILLLCIQQEMGRPLLERFGYPPPRGSDAVQAFGERLFEFIIGGIGPKTS